jgi:hypothetical protein
MHWQQGVDARMQESVYELLDAAKKKGTQKPVTKMLHASQHRRDALSSMQVSLSLSLSLSLSHTHTHTHTHTHKTEKLKQSME